MSPDAPVCHQIHQIQVCSEQILSAEGPVGAEIQTAVGSSSQKYFYILQKSALCAYTPSENEN